MWRVPGWATMCGTASKGYSLESRDDGLTETDRDTEDANDLCR